MRGKIALAETYMVGLVDGARSLFDTSDPGNYWSTMAEDRLSKIETDTAEIGKPRDTESKARLFYSGSLASYLEVWNI